MMKMSISILFCMLSYTMYGQVLTLNRLPTLPTAKENLDASCAQMTDLVEREICQCEAEIAHLNQMLLTSGETQTTAQKQDLQKQLISRKRNLQDWHAFAESERQKKAPELN
ncbi:MAG: hypothetical protein K9I85_16070 [Saprospiraceae bacterium]|nr:hypothetical protein [Saprospiraceae bacterium]